MLTSSYLLTDEPMDHYTPAERALRPAALLLLAGVVVFVVATLLHPGPPANDHPVAFAAYAKSAHWVADHFAQFIGIFLIVAGLVVLFQALKGGAQGMGPLCRLGNATAILTLGMYAVLQAVDGIALKHAVDAWAAAQPAEQAVRFANAETVRWLEWAAHSYFAFMIGLAFLLAGIAMVRTGAVPRGIGGVAGAAALAYFAQTWLLATEGFSTANETATTAGMVLTVAWIVWLAINDAVRRYDRT
jgi:hypothetical protein